MYNFSRFSKKSWYLPFHLSSSSISWTGIVPGKRLFALCPSPGRYMSIINAWGSFLFSRLPFHLSYSFSWTFIVPESRLWISSVGVFVAHSFINIIWVSFPVFLTSPGICISICRLRLLPGLLLFQKVGFRFLLLAHSLHFHQHNMSFFSRSPN